MQSKRKNAYFQYLKEVENMITIKLTDEQEQTWIENLKSDRCEFLARLLKRLNNNKNDIKLALGPDLLRELVIKRKEVYKGANQECLIKQDTIVDISANYPLNEICKYIDFSAIEYHDLVFTDRLNKEQFKTYKIPIIPGQIYNKDLSNRSFEDYIFKGSFDDCSIVCSTFKNCKDISGDPIKINPQTVLDNNLQSCKFEDVEFIGSFDDCNIGFIKIKNCKNAYINPQKIKDKYMPSGLYEGVVFTDSFDGCYISGSTFNNNNDIRGNNIKINPQKVKDRMLDSCVFEDVEFISSFDDCYIPGLGIKNCKNAHINPQKVKDRILDSCVFEDVYFDDSINYCSVDYAEFINVHNLYIDMEHLKTNSIAMTGFPILNNATIYVKNEHALRNLFRYEHKLPQHSITIIANLKHYNQIKESEHLKNAKFKPLHSKFDDDLDDIFNNSKTLKSNTEVPKQKKKSIFSRFK